MQLSPQGLWEHNQLGFTSLGQAMSFLSFSLLELLSNGECKILMWDIPEE